MPLIEVSDLSKTYRAAVKEEGAWATLRHFLSRRYRDVDAVRSVGFEIEAGQIVGFLGANGAGKTTLLKMLTGLVAPSGGRVIVAGHVPFQRKHAFLKRITLVMGQKQQLIWDLPALDSLKVNAAVYDVPDAEAKRRIGELAEMLEISSQLSFPVRKLSLGERMKCELLAALLHRPDVLFLDEPTLGLDVNAQDSIRRFLREYNALHSATILLTSHYMADIVALCPRVILMHEGRVIYDGSLGAIVDRFAPYREIELRLPRPVRPERLVEFGEVASVEGPSVRLIVERTELTRTIQRIFSELQPEDLSVKDPPVEEIVGRLFKSGDVESAARVLPRTGSGQ